MRETIFTTHNGNNTRCVLWDTVSNPIGIVQIIHGTDDRVKRYDRFAKYLNKNGYIVFLDIHHNHIGHPDIFMATVDDEIEILKYLIKKYKLPVFLLGYGYGSFITQRVMECTDLCAAGVCLAGGAQLPIWRMRLGVVIAWIGIKMYGANAPATLFKYLVPDGEKHLSYGFYYSFFHNLIQISYNIDCRMPILIISGGADLVCTNARLTTALYKTYQAHNMENLTVIIYPDAHHELLSELKYRDVQQDVLDFFNSIQRARNAD